MLDNVTATLRSFRSLARAIFRSSLGLAVLPITILIIIGTLVYAWLEGWSLWEALYVTVITITTVGYGDLSPQTFPGRVFAIFFTLIAIGLAGYAITTLAALVIDFETKRVQQAIQERRMNRISALKGHIIICGANVVAHRVANEFFRRQSPFVFIEPDTETLKWAFLWMNPNYRAKRRESFSALDHIDFEEDENREIAELAEEIGVLYLQEDPLDEQQLRRAGLKEAQGIIVSLKDDLDNLAVVLSARDMARRLGNEKLRIIARVHDEYNMRRLYLAGADKVVSPNFIGGFQIATLMLDPVMGEFLDHMLFRDDHLIRFKDMRLDDHPEWVGESVGELKQSESLLVVAIRRDGKFTYAPDLDECLQEGDILIVMGDVVKTSQ